MRLSGSEALGPPPPLGDLGRRTFVELLGAFALVFVGAGTIMSIGPQADAGTLDVALATGLAIAVMVTAVGHISGGHFNPAITFGFLLTRRITVVLGVAYIVAQLLGGVLAALLLRWIFPAANRDAANLGAPSVHTIDIGAALVVEALITFFLVWVVFAMTTDARNAYTGVCGARDRPRDRVRHAARVSDHRRLVQPGPRVRARAGLGHRGATRGSTTSARSPAAQ